MKVTARNGRQVPVQQYLQDAFLNMWETVLKTIADLDAVIGFEVGRITSSELQFNPIFLAVDERTSQRVH